jgi:hypothetical protein
MTKTKKTLMIGLMAAGVLAGSVVAPNFAEANHYYGRGRYENNRTDSGELRRDRRELWRDQAELERDREDLRRMYRNGASPSAIDRKKAEIRDDMRDVRRSQQEVWDSSRDVRRDGYRYDYDGRYSRGGWQRNDSPWWSWGNGWWR